MWIRPVRAHRVTVESETREAQRGSERSFASTDEVVEKFSKLTRAATKPKHQAALIDAVLNLEKLPDASLLARLLRIPAEGAGVKEI